MIEKPCPFRVGTIQAYVLHDASHPHTADDLIVNAQAAELDLLAGELNFDPAQIPVDYNNVLLMLEDRKILVDAGAPQPIGQLHAGLNALEVDPADIETIIITHADRDHIGGILDEAGNLVFPQAGYILLEDFWQYWSSERGWGELTRLNNWPLEIGKQAWETVSKIQDRIDLVQPGEQFFPGFTLHPALGHRYDHSILKVSNSDEQFVHLSDAVVHPLFMAKPEWYATYDAEPERGVKTKGAVLDMCAEENALVFGAHFPFPGLGYVCSGEGWWDWQPMEKE